MVWTEASLGGFLNLLREIALACPTSEMAWHPYSPVVQVLNFGKVPRVVFAHQGISFWVLKHCYQNVQEVLYGSSTQLEMRLTSRLGESIYPLENIKEL